MTPEHTDIPNTQHIHTQDTQIHAMIRAYKNTLWKLCKLKRQRDSYIMNTFQFYARFKDKYYAPSLIVKELSTKNNNSAKILSYTKH